MTYGKNTFVISQHGTFAWGLNVHGELGVGSTTIQTSPKRIAFPGAVLQCTSGSSHSLLLSGDNKVYVSGSDVEGRLVHVRLEGVEGEVVKIASGDSHSMLMKRDGSLYAWGSNKWGQLGIGIMKYQRTPVRVELEQEDIVQIECGGDFSMALNRKGLLYAWGDNRGNQLCVGNAPEIVPVPRKVEKLVDIVQIACGYDYAMALSKEGVVYSWGWNGYGQLGMPVSSFCRSIPIKIKALPGRALKIAAGCFHSMALLSDGSLYSWGDNSYGQLGTMKEGKQAGPARVNGIVGNIVQIKCGFGHSMVITEKDELYTWGYNGYGQLGNGSYKGWDSPNKIQFSEGRIVFNDTGIEDVQHWPASHHLYSIHHQNIIQELLLIAHSYSLPKEISIHFIKTFLIALKR